MHINMHTYFTPVTHIMHIPHPQTHAHMYTHVHCHIYMYTHMLRILWVLCPWLHSPSWCQYKDWESELTSVLRANQINCYRHSQSITTCTQRANAAGNNCIAYSSKVCYIVSLCIIDVYLLQFWVCTCMYIPVILMCIVLDSMCIVHSWAWPTSVKREVWWRKY